MKSFKSLWWLYFAEWFSRTEILATSLQYKTWEEFIHENLFDVPHRTKILASPLLSPPNSRVQETPRSPQFSFCTLQSWLYMTVKYLCTNSRINAQYDQILTCLVKTLNKIIIKYSTLITTIKSINNNGY